MRRLKVIDLVHKYFPRAVRITADRAKTRIIKRARRTRTNPKEVDMPIDQAVRDSLTPNEKRRWSYVTKAVPGLSLDQWIADGKPKPMHYRQRPDAGAQPARKAPSKPVRPPAETAPGATPTAGSAPAVKQPGAKPAASARPIADQTLPVADPLMKLAESIIRIAATRGGRCRVIVYDLALDGGSES